MTREEAIGCATEALAYVLENDDDYLATPVLSQWSEALAVLQAPPAPTLPVLPRTGPPRYTEESNPDGGNP